MARDPQTSERFQATIDAIDAANADDPHVIEVRGEQRPKERGHAELMTEWVSRLDPDADELQLIAARAHHIRRWAVPRGDYPDGRKGYLRWRTALKRMHADLVGEIMAEHGYAETEIERVQAIVAKKDLANDAAVQTHEDALCLVFVETQFGDLAERLDRDHMVDVVQKTLNKMTPDAIALAAGLPLTDSDREILAAALE